jgi:hypothetical protein
MGWPTPGGNRPNRHRPLVDTRTCCLYLPSQGPDRAIVSVASCPTILLDRPA